ncbi:Dimodular nonribosomal peptide synthase [Nocardiopsis dassonvillei]|uniref:amino acid adenylation domain-containing protein n=1 Tax=Nocardiopsis dassonvillei TaxID=2014 RepID=UPI003F55E867
MIPLSYAQGRLWFANRVEGTESVYNVPLVLRFGRGLRPAELRSALDDVVERHEVLRTVFVEHGGEPFQRVLTDPGDYPSLVVERCSEDEVRHRVEAFARQPFDLSKDVPLRARLFETGTDPAVLVLLAHHIVTDGWSEAVLLRDLASAYRSRCGGAAPGWEPLPVQYADFTLWQEELLGRPDDPGSLLAARTDFWRRTLRGAPEALDLPYDRPRPAVPTNRGSRVLVELDTDFHGRLLASADRHDCTVLMVVQAALALTLSAAGAGSDLPIGTPVAGRDDPALEDLVGFFVNMVVLRTDTSGSPTSAELLGRVRETDLDAFAHQDAPFERIVDAVAPERGTAHPLFQVSVTAHTTTAAAARADFHGVESVEVSTVDLDTAKFDLAVALEDVRGADGSPEVLRLSLAYALDVFDEATARALAAVLERALRLVVDDPGARPEHALVLTDEEKARLLGRLPAPAPAEVPASPRTEPESEHTASLSALFGHFLGREGVDPDQDFFRSGGDSLTALRLITRVRSQYGVELSVRDFFADPTVRGLGALLTRAGDRPAQPALAPRPRDGSIPLSHAQRRLWFIDQSGGDTGVYNVPLVLRFRGGADTAALGAALGDVVERHEVLRTVFPVVGGEPSQRVLTGAQALERLPWTVRRVDGDGVPSAVDRSVGHLFDTETDLPVLGEGLVLPGGDVVLVVVVRHIATDGWSEGVLLRDLAAAYEARCAGAAPGWEPLPVQYADYALWQRELLDGADGGEGVARRQLDYWTRRLEGIPQPLELPLDRPRPEEPTGAGGTVLFQVDEDVHRALLTLAADHGCTLFMVLQAAVAVVLDRSGAGPDVPLGTAVTGRGDPLLDDLVGFFVNTVVLRTDTSGAPSFGELLERVRRTDLEAFSHQDVPFEQVVEAVAPDRSAAHHPLFQVMVVLQDRADALPGFAGADVAREPFEWRAAKFDLTFAFAEAGNGLGCGAEFALDVFDRSTVESLVDRLCRVLEAVASDPGIGIADLPLWPDPPEPVQDTPPAAEDALAVPVHRALEGWARRTPGATALVFGEERVSYGELDHRADLLAAHLRERGAGPGDVVGILLERGVEFAVAVVAVLKTGAAYLALDPALPDIRLTAVAVTAACSLAVTDRDGAARFGGTAEPVLVDREAERIARARPADRSADVPASSTACVMFTSGSTGEPKGVAVSHRSLSSALVGQDYAGFGASSVWLQSAPVSWDGFALEFWGALLHGGTCVLQPGRSPEPSVMAGLAVRHGVTTLWLSAGLFNVMLDDYPEAFDAARDVLTGGEAASPGHLRRFRERFPRVRLVHGYGPVESMVFASAHRVEKVEGRSVPIGAPIAHRRCHVLDRFLRPVPEGVPGELYVAGAGLAHGYTARAALTAERFVPDPFSGLPGGRMYRTGDRARWAPGGVLEFLGRVDDQVKVRGFRIEPGEVAAALEGIPGVSRAAVVVRTDRPRDRRLVAYAVPEPGAELSGAAVRTEAAAVLPEYMVPSAVVVMESLPLSANGKLDRSALPAPAPAAAASSRGPRDEVERILCGLFTDVLGLDTPVGIDDSFFDLGGHSLLVMRLIAQVRDALGAELLVRQVFRHPTVALLRPLVSRGAAGAGSRRPELRPAPRPERVPLSYAQRRMWFLNRAEGTDSTYNVPLVLTLPEPLDAHAFTAALADVAARHEILRTVYAESEGEPHQRVLPVEEASIPLEPADGGARHPDTVREQVRAFCSLPFDLSVDGPVRARSFESTDGRTVVAVVVHHIACDGVSMSPLARDLRRAYRARRAGRAPAWESLPVQYTDYALWQREVLGDAEDPDSLRSGQLDFWRSTLAGAPEVIALPTDFPRPARPTRRGARRSLRLTPGASDRITALARAHAATPFMVVHAALAAMLARLGAGPDIVLGTPTAGRPDPALDDAVGFFVNTLVLRTDVSGDPSFADLLERVRDADLAAFDHQDVPFEEVVEALNPARSTAYNPLFQVMFAAEHGGHDPDGWTAAAPDGEDGTAAEAMFDLGFTLHVPEEGAVRLWVDYTTDLFAHSTADSLLRRLAGVLDAVTADPGLPVHLLDVRTEAERARTAGTPAGTAPRALPLLERFREQVERSPLAPAVLTAGAPWTYRDLADRSDRLAAHLAGTGVGAGDLVAVLMHRSEHAIAAMLAVLRTGAAFLPLDPGTPAGRVENVMAGAGARTVLVDRATRGHVGGAVEVEADRDTGWADPGTLPAALTGPGDPEDLAYVIYTSGSTGRPKGVAITHANVASFLAALDGSDYWVPAPRRSAWTASPAFDASMEQWMPIARGDTVVPVHDDVRDDARSMARTLADRRITYFGATPSYWESVRDEVLSALAGRTDADAPVLRLFLGGEAVPARMWRELADTDALAAFNGYGPTETTVNATATAVAGRVPHIGTPLPGIGVRVLDERLSPVPTGVTGELHIVGGTVARGYLGRPDLTAERFVPDPFSTTGGRMYRTGDLVRWRADGELEFLGRNDDQLKIRGLRVEPGEIETALAALPGVRRAAVVPRHGPHGPEIAAYVTVEEERSGARPPVGWRPLLAAQLPGYMLPSTLTVLDRIPVLDNGKTDLRALPEPVRALPGGHRPHSPREQVLCDLFAEVLGLDGPVGVEDDFFALGGTSLLVMRLAARARDTLGLELRVKDVFAAPTVSGILAADAGGGGGRALDVLLPLRAGGDRPPLFCVHPGLGMSWGYAGLLRTLDPGQPLYGLQTVALTRPDRMPESIGAVVEDYLDRMREVQPRGPYRLLGWSFGGNLAHEISVRFRSAGEQVEFLGLMDSFPSTPTTAPRTTGHRRLLGVLLDGIDPGAAEEADGPPFDRDDAVRALRARFPVLRGLAEAETGSLVDAALNHHELLRTFRPRLLDADVTFFTAARNPVQGGPAAWSEYVTGTVEEHRIDTDHMSMTDPEPLDAIGRIIAQKLDPAPEERQAPRAEPLR